MIRNSVTLLVLLLSPALGFTSVGRVPFVRPMTSLSQQKTNWPEYKHVYVDPLTPHQVESKVHDHVDPQKRAISNEYWLRQLEEDKAKLHSMTSETMKDVGAAKPSESFEHYKHQNIDPITPHETPSQVTSHMDPIRRMNADKYWRAVYIDEKEKLRKKHP